MSRKSVRRIGGLLVPLAALALASCSGGTAAGPESGSTSEVVADGYVNVTDTQGAVEGFVGASEDLELTTCEPVGDGWIADGTVTNPTDDEQSYRLYVAFNKGRDTKGIVQVDVASVEPGESFNWDAEAPLKGEGLDCSVRVERFDPQ